MFFILIFKKISLTILEIRERYLTIQRVGPRKEDKASTVEGFVEMVWLCRPYQVYRTRDELTDYTFVNGIYKTEAGFCKNLLL